MRDWPGLRLDKRPVGDGFVALDNVDYQTKGEVNRRRGLGSRVTTSPTYNRLRPYHTGPQVYAATSGGGAGVTVTNYASAAGHVTVIYEAYSIPDTFDILDDAGNVLATTGSVSFAGTLSTSVRGDFAVRVTGPSGTAWTYTVSYYTSPGLIGVQTGEATSMPPKVGLIGAGSGAGYNFADLASAARGGSLVTTADAAYWSDGVNGMRVFTYQTSADAGLAAPSAAPSVSLVAGGTVTPGTHLVRYRYYDSARRRYSDPSPAVEITVMDQITATGYATVSGGAVGGVIIVNPGAGYTGNQAATFGGPGTGAAATAWHNASRTDGALVSAQVTNAGASYTAAPTVTFPAPPTPPKTVRVPVVAATDANKIIVEMTLSNGSEFYQAAVVSNTSANVDVTMTDSTLAVQVAAADYTEDGYGHALPPKGYLAAVHNGRMFVWGATQEAADTLYWSRLGFVESWKPAEWSRRVFGATPDTPKAMFTLSDDLYLVGSRSMHRLIFTGDPGTGMLVPLPTTNGAWNQECVVEAEGAFFGFGQSGVWSVPALQPREISQPIRDFFADNIDPARGEESFGWWDPVPRTVNFCFYDTDGVRRVMSWWLDDQMWTSGTIKQDVSAAVATEWQDGVVEPMIAGEGCVYRISDGITDGGSANPTAVVQSYAAPTLTTTTNHGITVGTWMYFVRADQWAKATAVGLNTATITAVSGVLPGDSIEIGPIPVDVQTEWTVKENLARDRVAYLQIEAAKSETLGQIQVRFYTDWSSTPAPFTTDIAFTPPLGVTYDSANSRILVDLDACAGMTKVPVPASFNRCVKAKITSITSSLGLHLMDVSFLTKSKGAE